jgi:serine/threonine protein kinase
MYRDLKPCNVLLCEDGNIKLADMGGVADFGGDVFQTEEEKKKIMKAKKAAAPKEDFRRKSIMGTHGYMAPEMVKMLGQSRSQRTGYTAAVDYWSLGVSVYKLLTGFRPFDSMYADEPSTTTFSQAGGGYSGNTEYKALHRAVDYPSYISNEARSFIQGLLDTSEKTRIGCDENGIEGLKTHIFFQGVDWILMQQCHLEAPYVPVVNAPKEKPSYASYDDMMKQIDKDEKAELGIEEVDWGQLPIDEEQTFFDSWDFISPHTLKVEMGIANEMESHNANFKVRQMLGEVDDQQGKSGRGRNSQFGSAVKQQAKKIMGK